MKPDGIEMDGVVELDEPDDMAEDVLPKRQRGIQSIEVGGRLLLTLINAGEPMALRDLARLSGMPAAKAHKYLVSFGVLGLSKQDPATGAYDLGPLAIQLGTAALRRQDSLREAAFHAERLAHETGHAVFLTVLGNLGPTVVRLEDSGKPLHVNIRPGTVMSIMSTATGRVFGAYLPKAAVEKLVEEEVARNSRTAPIDDKAIRHFWECLEGVRQRGMARALGAPVPGINALCAPVFDYTGRLVLTMTAMGATGALDVSWNSETARSVAEAARRTSEQLGWG